MLRALVGSLVLVLLLASNLMAADTEYKGELKKVDPDKGTITVTVDGKDKDFMVSNDVKILDAKGGDLKDSLKSSVLKAGVPIIVISATKDGKEVVTKIQLQKEK